MILTRKIIVLGGSVGGSVKLNHMCGKIKGCLNLAKRVEGALLLGIVIGERTFVFRLESGVSEFVIEGAELDGECKCALIEEGCAEPIALGSSSKDRNYAALLVKIANFEYSSASEEAVFEEPEPLAEPDESIIIAETQDMPGNPDAGTDTGSIIHVNDVVIPKEESEENFYERIAEQMRDIFATHAHNDELENLVFNSEWVNIDYDETCYYVLGVIKDENEPVFICYGVPSENYSEPKEELGGMGQWLPVERENTEGRGYYMLYQNAKTGEIL